MTDDSIALTAAEWRAAMGAFPSGVTIVTSWKDGRPIGSTVNAFCSVSLDPPMLLICLDHNNPITEPLKARGVFGINILPEEGGDEAALFFARAPEDARFERYIYRVEGQGAPQLDIAPVFVDCTVESCTVAGDHVIVVGRGVRTEVDHEPSPLLYHRGGFLRMPRP
jgi:flavin reductase (DIM6/NTAB) family NADH-FMN oxidoreductase RutF